MRIGRRRRIIAAAGGGGGVPERYHWTINGTNEILADFSQLSLGIANAWTVSVTALLDDTTDLGYLFMTPRGASNANRIHFFRNSGACQVVAFDSGGTVFKSYSLSDANSGIAQNVGFTIAATWDGSSLLIYVDGTDKTSLATKDTDDSGTMTDSPRDIRIGAQTSGLNQLACKVQDFSVHPSTLSGANIAALYSQVNDPDPMSGFSPTIHFTPQDADSPGLNIGSGSAFDLYDDASGIDSSNRVLGNLITL